MPGLLGSDPAAHADLVIAKIAACIGCKRRPDMDTPHSYAFTINDGTGSEKLFYIPHEIGPFNHYTAAQLEAIEQTLARYGIDLMPLDHNLIH